MRKFHFKQISTGKNTYFFSCFFHGINKLILMWAIPKDLVTTTILLVRFAFPQLYRTHASKFLFYFILLFNISKMYLILVNYSVSSSSIASFLFCFNAANKSKNTRFSQFVVLPLLIWSVHRIGSI